MTRVHMDLDMEVSDLAEFRGYLRSLADWLEERGMMDADLIRDGRRIGRIGTEEDGDVPLRHVRDPVEGGHAPRVRVREMDPDVPAMLDEDEGSEAPGDGIGGGRRMNPYALDLIVRIAVEGDLRWLLDRGEGTQCQRRTAMMRIYASKLRRMEDVRELDRMYLEAKP